MIEISHQQAQHLIRQAVDHRLPDDQWSLLQGHLERCAACSAYSDRLANVEGDLDRVLDLRWGSEDGPAGLGERLAQAVERRQRLRRVFERAFRYALIGLAVVAVVALLRAFFGPVEQAAAPQPFATPSTELTPTPPPLTFRGQVAYASRSEGNSEIYLLTVNDAGRVEIANLTEHPAHDNWPAWSPDGEWLAFISNRTEMGAVEGKQELYVMRADGSRLTRLPSPPGVQYNDQPEWSPDGRSIFVIGSHMSGGPVFLYQAPVEGGEPRSIGFTRDTWLLTRPSPALPLLVFYQEAEGIAVFNLETGWKTSMSRLDPDIALASPFLDWSPDGRSLIYLAWQPAGADDFVYLRRSPELDAGGRNETITGSPETVVRLEPLGSTRAASWPPNTPLAAGLFDRGGDCLQVELFHPVDPQVPRRVFEGLCVESRLRPSNWTPDGNWLVLPGYPDEEWLRIRQEGKIPDTPTLYALRAAGDGDPYYERLEGTAMTAYESWGARVRPDGQPLGIDPVAAEGPQEDIWEKSGQAYSLGFEWLASQSSAPEWLYTSAYGTDIEGSRIERKVIYRSRPDGSEREALEETDFDSTCPRPGPGGKVAYLEETEVDPPAIYLMDADGSNRTALTQGGPDRAYGCPVWSPDGSTLAAYTYGGDSGLVLAPVDGSPPRHFRLSIYADRQAQDPARGLPDPLWIPAEDGADGGRSERLLLVQPGGGQAARLVEVDVSGAEDGALLEARTLAALTGWDDVLQLAYSPDGETLAALAAYDSTGQAAAQVLLLDAGTYDLTGEVPLADVDARLLPYSRLAWLPDGALGLVRSIAVVAAQKTVFERIDPAGPVLRAERVASYEHLLSDFAVIPTGGGEGWLGFATEGGFYAQSYSEFLKGEPPYRLWWDWVVDIGD